MPQVPYEQDEIAPPRGNSLHRPHGVESFWARLNRPMDAADVQRLLKPLSQPLRVDDFRTRWRALRGERYHNGQVALASLPWLLGSANLLCFVILLAFGRSSSAFWLQATGLFPMLAISTLGISWATLLEPELLRIEFADQANISLRANEPAASPPAASRQPAPSCSTALKLFYFLGVSTSLFGLCYFPQHGAEIAFFDQTGTVLPWGMLILIVMASSSLAAWLSCFQDNMILESTERGIEILIPNASVKAGLSLLLLAGLGLLTFFTLLTAGWLPCLVLSCALAGAAWGVLRLLRDGNIQRLIHFGLDSQSGLDSNQEQGGRLGLAAGATGALYGLLWYCQAEHLFTSVPDARSWWFLLTIGAIGGVLVSAIRTKPYRLPGAGLQPLTMIRVRFSDRRELFSLSAALPLINPWWRGPLALFRQFLTRDQKASLPTFPQHDHGALVVASPEIAVPPLCKLPAEARAVDVAPTRLVPRASKAAAFGKIAFAAAIGWLACKDWLTSNAVVYPYQSSLATTLAVFAAVVAVHSVRSPDQWRDLLLVLAMLSLIGLHADAGLPAMAVVALALPPCLTGGQRPTGGAAPERTSTKRPLPSAWLPRLPYALAALAGLTAMVLAPTSGLSGTESRTAAALVTGCVTAVMWSGTSFGRRIMPPTWAALAVFLLCEGLYLGRTVLAAGVWGSDTLPFNLRDLIVGTGLSDAGGKPASISSFIQEQGWVCWAITGLLLQEALCRGWAMLVRVKANSMESSLDKSAQDGLGAFRAGGDAVELAAGATAVLVALLAYGKIADSAPAIWVLALAVASLAIAGTGMMPAPAASPTPQRKRRLMPVAICAVISAVWLCSLWGIAWSLSASGIPPGATSFVLWSSLPGELKDAVSSDMTVLASPRNVHDLVRYSFGARVAPSLPMATVVAGRIVGTDWWQNPITALSSALLATMISSQLPEERIEELYLNYRDYGLPGKSGLREACWYYFKKEPGALSSSDARFLVEQSPPNTIYRFRHTLLAPAFLPATAPQYQYQQFDRIPDMDYMLHDGGINARGQVASYVVTLHHGTQPYLWQEGRFRMLPSLSPGSGAAVKLNDFGQAVGWSGTVDGSEHAVMWDVDGHIHDLGLLPGFSNSRAQAINNKGQIVGYAFNDVAGTSGLENAAHAFICEDGKMRDLGVPPGCTSSRAYAVNDAGQVAGWVLTDNDRTHAMAWENGRMHDIGTFSDGKVSVANAINNAGQVVGSADHADGKVTAFLWQNGTMHDLGLLSGDVYCRALGINDTGQVIGESRPNNRIYRRGGRAFLWNGVHGMQDLVPMLALSSKQREAMSTTCLALSINNGGVVFGLNRGPQHASTHLQFVLLPRKLPQTHD